MSNYDYSQLLGKIKAKRHTQASFSKVLGISETTLNLSLNNKRDFSQDEMVLACKELDIPLEEIATYFFAH